MRFVILEHRQVQGVHWDLLLQQPYRLLRTWALSRPLTTHWQTARELPPHRLLYLTYQGPVSGSRGYVQRWDQGTYRLQHEGPDSVCVLLSGQRTRGVLHLDRDGDEWTARFEKRELCSQGLTWGARNPPAHAWGLGASSPKTDN